ncbi:MAG: agmatine deiminase family protein [Candidatus Sumerlaeaceae bacterium]|nr:agmatine deiminase family protein [Candidatus Sumerlaeaceae bacterium]
MSKKTTTVNLDTPPFGQGFRMPAEWEPHEATWLTWPQNSSDWPGKLPVIPWVYGEIIRHLTRHERVCIIVADEGVEQRAWQVLGKVGVDRQQVEFFRMPTNRSWIRDSGPLFVVRSHPESQEVAATAWKFNAWAKYEDHNLDEKTPGQVAARLKMHCWRPIHGQSRRHVVLEGGAIDVNGAGLMLATEECLLSKQQHRNPGMDREDYEKVVHDYLGVKKVIWLKAGIVGDDTHGHVDDVARFVDRTTVVAAIEKNRSDANHEPLEDNLSILKDARGVYFKRLRVVPIPMPAPLYFRGQRLPASYLNFYIANNVVLVPTFNDPNDRVALTILQELFSSRKVIGINCTDLVWGLGTIHCLTQQQPAQQPE